MGFAMLLALPAMLFAGSLLDALTADDAHAMPDGGDTPEQDSTHGDLLDAVDTQG